MHVHIHGSFICSFEMLSIILFLAPLLLNAVEEYGQDWDKVAQTVDISNTECEEMFTQLSKKAKKEDAFHKKEINRTGIYKGFCIFYLYHKFLRYH